MLESILEVLLGFGQLAGVAAAITVLVDVFKRLGLVKDNDGGKWFAALNLVALGVLVSLRLFAPEIPFSELDQQAALFAQITLIILGYVTQLFTGSQIRDMFMRLGLPLCYSNTDAEWRKTEEVADLG